MKEKINKSLFYTLIVLVYGTFFSVQSFFNLGEQFGLKQIAGHASYAHHPENDQSKVKTSPLNSSSSHKIRLNKRFHQEDISPCPAFYVVAPELYVTPRVLGSFRTFALPTVTVTHRRLRGPPFIA